MPRKEENRIVRAVAVSAGAGTALSDAIEILARYTVDAGDLVVRSLASLGLLLELLHSKDKECELLRVFCVQLSNFVARLGCAWRPSDGETINRRGQRGEAANECREFHAGSAVNECGGRKENERNAAQRRAVVRSNKEILIVM